MVSVCVDINVTSFYQCDQSRGVGANMSCLENEQMNKNNIYNRVFMQHKVK